MVSKVDLKTRVTSSIELIINYGLIDGGHHKQWVLDQVLRVLAGNQYEKLIADVETYSIWDEGIAP